MTIHEFGEENREVIVLLHPSMVMWDYFEYVIPLMQERYHLDFAGHLEQLYHTQTLHKTVEYMRKHR